MGNIKAKQEPRKTRRSGVKHHPPPHWIDWDGDYVRQIDRGKNFRELNYGKAPKWSVPVQPVRPQEEEEVSERFNEDFLHTGLSRVQEEGEVRESFRGNTRMPI